MKIRPGNAQHVGNREEQQDAFGFEMPCNRRFATHGGIAMALCDGMGGLQDGAAASNAAVAALLSNYARKTNQEAIADAIDRSVRAAQEAVGALGHGENAPGTTMVMAVVHGNKLHWSWLGDSRLYLCRGDEAQPLTIDHNVRNDPEVGSRAGASDEALTRYLGAPDSPRPGQGSRKLRAGDRVVACSDGLYRVLAEHDIAFLARRYKPMIAAERMVDETLARKLPHQDNIAVAILAVDHPWPLWLPTGRRLAILLAALSLLLLTAAAFSLVFAMQRRQSEKPAASAAAVATPTPPTDGCPVRSQKNYAAPRGIPAKSMAPKKPNAPKATKETKSKVEGSKKSPAEQSGSDTKSAKTLSPTGATMSKSAPKKGTAAASGASAGRADARQATSAEASKPGASTGSEVRAPIKGSSSAPADRTAEAVKSVTKDSEEKEKKPDEKKTAQRPAEGAKP